MAQPSRGKRRQVPHSSTSGDYPRMKALEVQLVALWTGSEVSIMQTGQLRSENKFQGLLQIGV